MQKLLVFDVSSYIFRAYHAVPPLTTPKGEPANAIFGFINMFLKTTRKFKDFSVLAALDSGREKSFRKELFESYKANRKEIDEELRSQFKYITPMLDALNIPSLMVETFEADDIIASCVRKFSNYEVLIVSSDKDLTQLIDEKTLLYDGMKDKIIDAHAVLEKFEVFPNKMKELLGLMGDSSDNIPGIPGVGPKTASSLLNKFGSIEGIYQNIGALPQKQQEKLIANKDLLELSLKLVELRDNLPLPFVPHKWESVNEELFVSFATEMGFKSLIKLLGFSDKSAVFKEAQAGGKALSWK